MVNLCDTIVVPPLSGHHTVSYSLPPHQSLPRETRLLTSYWSVVGILFIRSASLVVHTFGTLSCVRRYKVLVVPFRYAVLEPTSHPRPPLPHPPLPYTHLFTRPIFFLNVNLRLNLFGDLPTFVPVPFRSGRITFLPRVTITSFLTPLSLSSLVRFGSLFSGICYESGLRTWCRLYRV